MNKSVRMGAILPLLLAGVTAVQAHHSYLMYDPTPLWVEGTVVGFDNINPHTITTIEGQAESGQLRRWAVEGPGRSQFGQLGITAAMPAVGEVVGFCAFPYKSADELARLFPDADFSRARYLDTADAATPQFVWGHVMVTADGAKRAWNPHGVLSECIRSSGEPLQSWIDYINSRPQIRDNWCQQRGYPHIRSDQSLAELVDEIDALIDRPCN